VILAIDTATQNASVALYDSRQVWAERVWNSDRNHTIELMPAVAAMLSGLRLTPRELRGVAVAMGPGSFTGMRIGLSVAKGLAISLGIPVVGVPTLDIMGQPFSDQRVPVCAIVHAGRGRFCAATYKRVRGVWSRQGEFRLVTPAALPDGIGDPTIFCGELDDEAREALRTALGEKAIFVSPARNVRRAAFLAELAWDRLAAGAGDDVAALSPIYLNPVQERGD
jgi:tRNA threonylcarbamoyladenosine biosynthesis protein TsaB